MCVIMCVQFDIILLMDNLLILVIDYKVFLNFNVYLFYKKIAAAALRARVRLVIDDR